MWIEGILDTHTAGSAGAHCGTTLTLLNSAFAHLKEETQPSPVVHVSLQPLSNTVNMILEATGLGAKSGSGSTCSAISNLSLINK